METVKRLLEIKEKTIVTQKKEHDKVSRELDREQRTHEFNV